MAFFIQNSTFTEYLFILFIYIPKKVGRFMLSIRLPVDIEARLTRLAKKTGRTKTFYAREAILEYIEDLEDLYLAKKRLGDIQKGKTKTIKLNLLESELGSVC
jgi:RHH-type transcriptional regulator, rel operon repressor / antitoxin RelB